MKLNLPDRIWLTLEERSYLMQEEAFFLEDSIKHSTTNTISSEQVAALLKKRRIVHTLELPFATDTTNINISLSKASLEKRHEMKKLNEWRDSGNRDQQYKKAEIIKSSSA